MGEFLGSIKSCCVQLEEKTITTRKAAADRLCALLSNSRICAQLDQAGRDGALREWNWQDVYNSTHSFLKLEAEKLIADESKNVGTEGTRDKKKKSMVGVLKLVLSKGRLQLAWGSVIKDLLCMLEMPHMRILIASPLTRLLADFLKDPLVRSLVKSGDWPQLLQQIHQLVEDAPPGLEKSLVEVVNLLCLVLTQGPKYSSMFKELSDLRTWKLVRSLLLLRDDVMRPESDARIESIKAANILLRQASLDFRKEACRLGEDTVQSVVRSWDDKKDGNGAVLEFLRLQMAVHHPLGASLEEEGAMYINKAVWNKQLARIFCNVVDTTIRNRARQRGIRDRSSKAMMDFELEPALLGVAVKVVHQLLVSPIVVDLADVTQLVPLDTTQLGPAAKRRRVSSAEQQRGFCLESLLAEVAGTEDGQHRGGDARVLWLQILSSLIQDHPGALAQEQAELVLRVLSSLLQTSRNLQLRRHALAASRWLLESGLCASSQEWNYVSSRVLNMLSINQAGAEGHGLVRCLLEEGKLLAEPVMDLFSTCLVKQDKESLSTLGLLLRRWPPKDHVREKLLAWLIPAGEDDGARVGGRTMWEEGELIAAILELLVTKKLGEDKGENKRVEDRHDEEILLMEKKLLQLALIKNINEKETHVVLHVKEGPAPVVLHSMTNLVQEVLTREAGELTETLHGQPESLQTLTEAIQLGGALLLYVSHLQRHSEQQPRLASIALQILKTCGSLTSKLLSKNGPSCKSLISAWSELAGRGQALPEDLVSKLEAAVEKVVVLRQREQKQTSANVSQNQAHDVSRGSGDNYELDDFDDFSNGSDSGTMDLVQDESLDLGTSPEKDVVKDLALISSLLILLAKHAIALKSEEKESSQAKVVELLVDVLDCHNHCSSDVLDICVPVVSTLTSSPQFVQNTVELLVDMVVKNLAAASINKTKFHEPGVSVLLQLMKLMIPGLDQIHPPSEDSSQSRAQITFCRVLQGLVKLSYGVDTRRLGHDLVQALTMVVGKIAKLEDPRWTIWSAGHYLMGDEGQQSIAKCLPKFLEHAQAEVRLAAATQLALLRPNNGQTWLESTITPFLGKPFAVQTSLVFLASLAREQPSLTTPILTTLFATAHQASSANLLSNATALLGRNSGTDSEALLMSRLPCLLADHLKRGLNIQDFPCSLFAVEQANIKEFLKSQERSVVPVVLLHDPTQACLSSLAKMFSLTPKELVARNLRSLALHFTPGVVALANDLELPERDQMVRLANLVKQHLGHDFNTSVATYYHATLENAFCTAYDPKHLSNTFGFDHLPEITKPCQIITLNASMPKALIQFYEKNILGESDRSLWSEISKKWPDKLMQLLSLLTSAFNERGLSIPSRLRGIHSLWIFLDELGDHLEEPELQTILPALALMPSSSLLHLLHSSQDHLLLRAGLVTLQKLIVIITPISATGLHPVIYSITYCLVALSSQPELMPLTLEILNFLFVRHGFRFGSVLQHLEDFPSTPSFSDLQAAINKERVGKPSLAAVMERFLEVAATTEPAFLLSPLRRLRIMLQTELAGQTLNMDMLRRLFACLLKVANSEEGEASVEALKCLGEIGPMNLDSPILQVLVQNKVEWCSSPKFSNMDKVMLELKKLLLGSNGEISRVAATAISKILSNTQEGEDWLTPEPGKEESALQEFFAAFQQPSGVKEGVLKRVDVEKVRQTLDSPALWSSTEEQGPWLRKLVETLLECFCGSTPLKLLSNTCRLSLELCKTVLPSIVHQLLLVDCSDARIIVSKKVNELFRAHFEEMSCPNPTSGPTNVHPQCLGALLDVVTYLRTQPIPPSLSPRGQNCWESNFWFADINYLHCARAALSCGRPTDALQLATVWFYQKERDSRSTRTYNGSTQEPCLSEELQQVLYRASLMLGDTDTALGTGLNLEPEDLDLLLPIRDSRASDGGSQAKQSLVNTLYNSGLHHTLSKYLTAQSISSEERQIQEDCAWRLQQWDTFSPEKARKSVPGCLLGGLHGASNGDLNAVEFWGKVGHDLVRTKLQGNQLVTTTALHPLLTELRQLGELELLSKADDELGDSVTRLLTRDEKRAGSFSWLEPVLSQRQVLASNYKHLQPFTEKLALHASRAARGAQQHWICERQLGQIEPSMTVRWEKMLVMWSQGQRGPAVSLSKKLLSELEASSTRDSKKLLPQVTLQLGKWLDHQKTETSRNILNQYLVRSVDLFESGGACSEDIVRAHLSLAQFADKQFKQVKEYMDSGEFQERQEGALRIHRDVQLLKNSLREDKGIGHSKTIKERFANMDIEDAKVSVQEAEQYLTLALKSYLAVLCQGNGSRSQAAVYRLVALWFANADSISVLKSIPPTLPRVPSWKFVPLLYQIAARMEEPRKDNSDSATALYNLVLRCAQDHPHHALPIILALVNAKEDEKLINSKNARNSSLDGRGVAASKIVATLKQLSGEVKAMVERYKFFSLGLINLAYVEAPKKNSAMFDFPKDQPLLKVKGWTNVAVITDTLAVAPDKNYSHVPGVAKYIPTYSMVGGVNAPKKISCVGTDGHLRLQLVKGRDDLRQDCVMEQVFGLVNQLLDQDEESQKQKLSIRTYKVVPLSQRSGILQWCSNTMPLAIYLVGADQRSGAHKRFHPKQWESASCRRKMAENKDKNKAVKEKVFHEICSNFSPAMKYFFLENFPTSAAYYLARSAYTKSAATNSMVGHILGLGDRHTNNILIDSVTGELIHIDLGVAFEQGKILPTPEKIPFRLTRDILDGFGPTGVEGVFRKNCERTMEVLKEHKAALVTVLEVLLHDPLFNWSVGPSKAAAKQDVGQWEEMRKEEAGVGNRMASRALIVVSGKLDGREDGATLSVEGQVSTLIQRATDPANLSAIFDGWAPWC